MRFLCLAYGDEAGWDSLSKAEREKALAHDAVIRDRGNLMSAVRPTVTSVKNWKNRKLQVSRRPYARHRLPLAGFSAIEAESVEEVVKLVRDTPCARARGVIEIRLSGRSLDEQDHAAPSQAARPGVLALAGRLRRGPERAHTAKLARP
jgi:hypothetical protein